MLDELHVKNVALIANATFAPASGLTVITGETGAGKTALLSAIKLLVGERADAATVREGADQATVEGRWFAKEESGPDAQDGHVAVRTVTSDGRSRVSIDGSMATVRQLAAQVGSTVDLCGQHEHQHLLKQANHVRMLDAWAGDAVAVAKRVYLQAFDAAEEAAAHVARVQEESCASAAQLDEARFIIARIEEAAPSQDEYDDIMAQLPRVENAEALAEAANAAYSGLAREGGAIEAVNAAACELERIAKVDPAIAPLAASLADASYVLEDAAHDLRAYRDGIDHDPQAFARLQERIGTLQGLMRTYGPRMEDVLARRDAAQHLLDSVADADRLLEEARAAQAVAEGDLARAAAALDDARAAAAPRFSEAVNAQMARLEMGGAELICAQEPLPRDQWNRTGASRVEFLYRAGAGMTPRPLARIASGGEVSRVMLACKVVLGEADERDTLIFDEVDAGVGGQVAVALAGVLADLAKTHQVIVVTHLPQVAVCGAVHYVVQKQAAPAAQDGIPQTALSVVEGEARVAEIARMLSGSTSDASLAHAQELLAASQG